jgi:cytochrome c
VKRLLFCALVSLGVVAAGNAWANCTLPAEAEAGRSASNQCRACHGFEADRPSRPTGPNLHEIYGSTAGSRSDFDRYSEGMVGARARNVAWTDDTLFEYIGDPRTFLNKVNAREVKHTMLFQMNDAQKRRDVIALLKAIKGKPECD